MSLPTCSSSQKLLVTVISTPSEIYRRKVIRRIWGHPSRYNSSFSTLVFIIGRTEDPDVLQEAREYNDLIITDINENYYNLSLKTYAGLRYAQEHCPGVECIIKSDSDNVLHLRDLEDFCRNHMNSGGLDFVAGHCIVGRIVKRNRLNKWFVPFFVYPEFLYPQYCSTGAYFFVGKSAWQRILEKALVSRLFSSSNFRHLSEDVLFAGLFPGRASIPRINIWGFSFVSTPDIECVHGVTRTYSIHLNDIKQSGDEYNHIEWNFARMVLNARKECTLDETDVPGNTRIRNFHLKAWK